MKPTDRLRHQHDRILNALDNLSDALQRQSDPRDAHLAFCYLMRLSLVQLAREQLELLPALRHCSEPALERAVQEDEGEALTRLLERHDQRFCSADDVQLEWPAFVAAASEVDVLLRQRIETQAGGLYPLADRLLVACARSAGVHRPRAGG